MDRDQTRATIHIYECILKGLIFKKIPITLTYEQVADFLEDHLILSDRL